MFTLIYSNIIEDFNVLTIMQSSTDQFELISKQIFNMLMGRQLSLLRKIQSKKIMKNKKDKYWQINKTDICMLRCEGFVENVSVKGLPGNQSGDNKNDKLIE